MAKANKKKIRARFNEHCMFRDNYKCKFCTETENLEVHHITNRNLMPNGGYVESNGITVCPEHHLRLEGGSWYCEPDLYTMIGSSYNKAYQDSLKL